MIRLKRAYEPADAADGERLLVDRLWPRGLSREKAAVDEWLKDIAPSTELRKWFAHREERWPEFKKRYRSELRKHDEIVADIARRAARGTVTLVYGARDKEHNDAVVLADAVRSRMKRKS
ncbi:MAG TPA: DUF488 family protein [Longimicrobiales bacterium]